MSICPSARINWAPTGPICVQFDICDFVRTYQENSNLGRNMGHST